jgi:hypothetical protein
MELMSPPSKSQADVSIFFNFIDISPKHVAAIDISAEVAAANRNS